MGRVVYFKLSYFKLTLLYDGKLFKALNTLQANLSLLII